MSFAHLQMVLCGLHYSCPVLVLAYYLVTQSISLRTAKHLVGRAYRIQRRVIVVLEAIILLSYVSEISLLIFGVLLIDTNVSSYDSNVS